MRILKEVILGLLLVSTAVVAGQDDIITRLAIENARFKPEQAIEKVLKEHKGALSEFSVEDDDDRILYEFTLIDREKGVEVELEMSAETGEILDKDQERIRSWRSSTKKFGKKKYQLLFDGKVTLESAVAEAKKLVPGTLVEAELEQEKGVIFFEIEILTDNGVRKVIVDLQSGKLIPVASR